MDLGLRGRRVLVTGGNSGLGAAIVRRMADEGARVAINFVADPGQAGQLAAECRGRAAAILLAGADVSKPEAVAAMFRTIDGEWNGIDVLVNNAGIDGPRAPTWEVAPEDWQRVLQVNLGGAFHCAREALRRMVAAGSGVIINISSVHEQIAWSGYGAYAASKAGLSMLSRTMAQEAGPRGVRVLCVAPGAIRTPINAGVWRDPEGLRDLLGKIPLGRIGEPDDIARLVAVLASDVSAYVTGTSVFIDGGMTDYAAFAHGG